ncbi:hypothetical protein [Devosia psychrophila]|jgi:hypothetical protein|uniref:Uncharacterized protein n=1 Tax=Devosia psychrophila TaxID=728005 RepID=A0A0F5PRC1_9HYPH|nr:hypothetical protein [Devosia psychrophila]KKC31227.1 hypothetical protein WH91_20685 [Devosia psychrophila]SFC65655.1 hypothetical protein SAMN04488059_10896 [Devosia psychrophila]
MSLFRLAAALVAIATLALPAFGQEDAVGIPGPISFQETDFALAWTSHPFPAYFKQEYLPEGETVEAYNQMFMVDVLTEGGTPETTAADVIAGLEERKANDPVVNYAMVANDATGELILDFLVSDSSTGTIIVEWNAYRYVPYGEGFVLYAISRRAYGDLASDFIGGLKDWRTASISALASMELPDVQLD